VACRTVPVSPTYDKARDASRALSYVCFEQGQDLGGASQRRCDGSCQPDTWGHAKWDVTDGTNSCDTGPVVSRLTGDVGRLQATYVLSAAVSLEHSASAGRPQQDNDPRPLRPRVVALS
jgi:hypothetical protein